MTVSFLTPLLPYCGVDLVLAPDGRWRIIEVNDHPVALSYALSLYVGQHPMFFDGDPFGEIAKVLLTHAQNGPIPLLLPECFRIAEGYKWIDQVQLSPGQNFWDDSRISATLNDFNMLAGALKRLKGEGIICDVTQIAENGSDIVLQDGRVVRALFRRASEFPIGDVDCFCINPRMQRLLCGDKLKTHLAMRTGGVPSENLIPTFPYARETESLDFLEQAATNGQWVIIKPRYGGASCGVERQSARQALNGILNPNTDKETPDEVARVVQSWIRPALTKSEKGQHYFDIRLFLVDGVAVSGFARRSSAVVGSVASETPLEWLTTTGKIIPLGMDNEQSDIVRLLPQDIAELRNICRLVVQTLSDAAWIHRPHGDKLHLPCFTQMANVINGKLEYVMVQ